MPNFEGGETYKFGYTTISLPAILSALNRIIISAFLIIRVKALKQTFSACKGSVRQYTPLSVAL